MYFADTYALVHAIQDRRKHEKAKQFLEEVVAKREEDSKAILKRLQRSCRRRGINE